MAKKVKRDSTSSLNWQAKQIKAGKCRTCGEPSNGYLLCPKHRKMDLARKKKAKKKRAKNSA